MLTKNSNPIHLYSYMGFAISYLYGQCKLLTIYVFEHTIKITSFLDRVVTPDTCDIWTWDISRKHVSNYD
jgi:hypothetical protein